MRHSKCDHAPLMLQEYVENSRKALAADKQRAEGKLQKLAPVDPKQGKNEAPAPPAET